MTAQPLVSVIVPAYNVEAYVAEAVDSALSQTYSNVEVVVIDDGSTDGTVAELAQFGDRIVIVRQENRGLPGARNAGIGVSTGAVIGLLDGDDVWLPERIERCVEVLLAAPAVGIVTTDALLVDSSGRSLGQSYRDLVPAPTGDLAEAIVRENVIFGSVLMRRSILEQSGLFDASLTKGAEDYDMWLRQIASGVEVVMLPEALALYRIRGDSLTRTSGGLTQSRAAVLERHLPGFWSKGIYGPSNQALRIAWNLARRGDWARARRFLTAAFRDPERNPLEVAGAAVQSTLRQASTRVAAYFEGKRPSTAR